MGSHHRPPPHNPHPYLSQPHLPNFPPCNQCSKQHYLQERQNNPSVPSLLRRITALESAFLRRSSHSSSRSLRHAAARTIQTHFRAFLMRRLATLRQLRRLFAIKKAIGFLKCQTYSLTDFDSDGVHGNAVKFLLEVETIKSDDPLVRDRKRSVHKKLNKFLNYLDGVWAKKKGLSSGVNVKKSWVSNSEREVDNVNFGGLKRVKMEKWRAPVGRLAEDKGELTKKPKNDFVTRNRPVPANTAGGLVKQHSGFQPIVRKNVSFAKNGKAYGVSRRHHEPFMDESNDRARLVDAETDLDDGDNDCNNDNEEEESAESWINRRGEREYGRVSMAIKREDIAGIYQTPKVN